MIRSKKGDNRFTLPGFVPWELHLSNLTYNISMWECSSGTYGPLCRASELVPWKKSYDKPLCWVYLSVLCLVSQSCPTLCNPTDCSPPGSSVHGDSPGKNTGAMSSQGIFSTQELNWWPVLQAASLPAELPGKSHGKPRQCIKKQRHHFANKGPYSQSYGFPVVMYGCDSWTIKKAERQRNAAFKLWCWKRLLRAPWTARRSNKSILSQS